MQNLHERDASFLQLMEECVMPADVPARGSYITATVLSIGRNGAVVSFGGKSDAYVPGKEMGKTLVVGESALFAVISNADENDCVMLSRRVVELWDELGRNRDNGTTIKVKVDGVAKKDGRVAGVRVRYRDLAGFLPASLMGALPVGNEKALVDSEVVVKVTKANRMSRELIVDRLGVEQDERALTLKPGDMLQGTVASVTDFGLFVDIGKAQGLVHVSEIPPATEPLAQRFARGTRVDVQVLGVQERRGKRQVSLSILRPAQDRFLKSLAIGEVIEGTVARRMDYGFFVTVSKEAKVNGLLHSRELPWAVRNGARQIKEGDTVKVRVILIEPASGRVGLSMRDLPQS